MKDALELIDARLRYLQSQKLDYEKSPLSEEKGFSKGFWLAGSLRFDSEISFLQGLRVLASDDNIAPAPQMANAERKHKGAGESPEGNAKLQSDDDSIRNKHGYIVRCDCSECLADAQQVRPLIPLCDPRQGAGGHRFATGSSVCECGKTGDACKDDKP